MGIQDRTLSQASGGRLEGVDVLRGLSVLLLTLHPIHLRFVLNDYPVEHFLPGVLNRVAFFSGCYAVRLALEKRSCECYHALRQAYGELVGRLL